MPCVPYQNDTQGCRVIELDHLIVPGNHDELERMDIARRFLTLLQIQTDENREGGSGKALKFYNCVGEPICLKSLRAVTGFAGREDERQRAFEARKQAFLHEYNCQTALRGIPGVPMVYGYGTYAGGPVMLMEWIQGHSIREALLPRATRLKDGIGVRVLSALGATVASILCAARERDPYFVHRDLSGMNILIRISKVPLERQISRGQFDLKLIDFGSAMCSSIVAERKAAGANAKRVWRNGTPEYAPPEMLNYDSPRLVAMRGSEAIDVYEFSSVLYELYCGYTPYRLSVVKPASNYLYKIQNRVPAPPLRQPEDRAFVALIMQGLLRDQTARPTLSEFRYRMEEICRKRDKQLADCLHEQHERTMRIAQISMKQATTDLSPVGVAFP